MKSDKISYSKQTIENDDIKRVIEVLKSPYLTQGPTVKEFEDKLSKITESKYAVAVNSGTAALHLACLAINLKEHDQVITSPLSFAATSNCILYCNAVPVFADVDESGLLSPKEVLKKINNKTKAVITVDYGGLPSHINDLKKICRKYNLILIEDAAHSLGASYCNKPVGSLADLICFSFHPVKSITTGEGGAITTNSYRLKKILKKLRSHGITKDKNDFINIRQGPWYYEMQDLGYNYRISDIQSALGVSQLNKLNNFITKRREIAQIYNLNLKKFENKEIVILPKDNHNSKSSWHLYPLRINFNKIKYSKKQIFDIFLKNNIQLQVHYLPIHLHPYYAKRFGYKIGDFNKSETFSNMEISLPLYPTLTKHQIKKVIKLISRLLDEN